MFYSCFTCCNNNNTNNNNCYRVDRQQQLLLNIFHKMNNNDEDIQNHLVDSNEESSRINLFKTKIRTSSGQIMSKRVLLLLASSGGSRLIDNFSQFLASRNVINHSKYDKILNNEECKTNNAKKYKQRSKNLVIINENHQNESQEIIFFDGGEQPQLNNLPSSSSKNNLKSYNQNKQQQPTIFRYNQSYHDNNNNNQNCFYKRNDYFNFNLNNNDFKNNFNAKGTKLKFQLLFRAIISGNKNSSLNKTSLFLSILKAPIVLAAIFSMLLILSLMILYTMSFHHYHCHLMMNKNDNLSTTQIMFDNKNEKRIDKIDVDKSGANEEHVINSRHLLNLKTNYDNESEKNSTKTKQFIQFKITTSHSVENHVSELYQNNFDKALTVQTECGSYVGSPEGGAIIFKGIPYASPPIGQRRWTRPRPIWLDQELCKPNRISEMRLYKPHCAQLSPMTRRFTGQEDCLYLDIYAPKLGQSDDQAKVSYIKRKRFLLVLFLFK